MSEKLVLIDGHSILNRAFYGMPDLTNAAGIHTGAVYGFLNILFRIMDEEKPDYLTVAFDTHAPTFRHEVYADYKGTRHAMPDELREQVPLMKKVLGAMGIRIVEQAGLEADDLLGTLAKKGEQAGMQVRLVSGDRDLLQIASDNIQIRIPKTKKGQTTIENYFAGDVLETMLVTPEEFIQVKALQGDSSDNIPGVPKVGPKTATELVQKYHSVAGVYEHLGEITRKSLHDTLEQNRALADLSLFLVTIKTDCDIPVDWDAAHVGNFYTKEAFELYTELGFKNLLRRFSESTAKEAVSSPVSENVRIIRNNAALDKAFAEWAQTPMTDEKGQTPKAGEGGQTLMAGEGGQTLSTSPSTLTAVYLIYDKDFGLPDTLLGAAVAAGGKTYYVSVQPDSDEATSADEPADEPVADALSAAAGAMKKEVIRQEDFVRKLRALRTAAALAADGEISPCADAKELLCANAEESSCADAEESLGADANQLPSSRIAVFGIKEQYRFWGIQDFDQGIRLDGILDLLVAAYLINPLKSDYAPEDVASEYLGQTIIGEKQLLEKKTFRQLLNEAGGEEKVASFACAAADALRKAAPLLEAKLREQGMWNLYCSMERPLTYILYDMERIGVKVLPEKLQAYSDRLTGRIEELEKSIHEQAGSDFNISSPKQLGEILFEQMHLPGGKKTKTGYSTAADVLEKLAPEYPFVADVLEYRGLSKLKSTYADGLAAFIADDSRIHTTFHQTITATGRISSTDPNLQNIPMRTELGREIRKVFVPSDGYCFTDADYSQIELRILAHMSGDESLIEAYQGGKDIHRMTAAKVFNIPFDEVTPLQRRNAKAVNFGIVYGISSFGLSQNISISRKEAAEYIEQYFHMFPGIRRFLDEQVSEAKKNGYSTTLFGRRRPIPELKNSNFMQRQFGERVAMNAPIQGTGADIMKIAMIRVWEELHRRKMKSRLILQIHDELLIETAAGEEEQVESVLREGMMGAAKLKVELEVDCHTGSDWYEAK